MTTKICSRCYIGKGLFDFSKDKSSKDGLSYTCKLCKKSYNQAYYENNNEIDVKIWADNDQTTWTWSVDHIIPKSHFKYNSVEEESFQKCWSLENLRPYSSKQNIVEGNRRGR